MIKALTVWDQEELHYIAEEVLIRLRYDLYLYDDEGNYLHDDEGHDLTGQARRQAVLQSLDRQEALGDRHYLEFRGNKELQQIPFSKALEMPLETIKEKYLKYALDKARNMMRKGTVEYGITVSSEVPDSYLDDLLALRWRENLKLWTMQWEDKKKYGGERPET